MEDNLQQDEFTFSKLGALLKKSFVRIVVYVLVALILVTSCLLAIKGASNKSEYRAQILFSNSGIENGMSPWNASLDITKDIKSSALVNEALESIGITDEAKRVSKISTVIANLNVTADFSSVVDEKNPLSTFTFNVSLNNSKALGLSSSQCNGLLDAIVDGYIKSYKEKYSYANIVQKLDEKQMATYNYVLAMDVISQNVDELIAFTDVLAKADPTFKSTVNKMSFGDIKIKTNGLVTAIQSISSYVLSNGITSSASEGATELAYLNQEIQVLAEKDESLKATLADLKEQSDQASKKVNNITSGNGTSIIIDDKYYYELVAKVTDMSALYNNNKAKLSMLTKQAASFGPNSPFELSSLDEKTQKRTQTDKMIKSLLEDISTINVDLDNSLTEYRDTAVLKNAVYKSINSRAVVSSTIGMKTILLIDVFVTVMFALIAVLVTRKRGKIQLIRSKKAVAIEEPVVIEEKADGKVEAIDKDDTSQQK